MAALTYLVSGLVTALLLLAIVASLARSREWRSYVPMEWSGSERHAGVAASLVAFARTPLAWTVAFLVLLGIVGAGTVAFVMGSVPSGVTRGAGVALAAVTVAVLCGYLFWGVHRTTKHRGFKSSQAAVVGLWALGIVFLVVIVARLAMA